MIVKTIKRALYIGSFDPFTSGHYDILLQAEKLFDEIIIAIANNPQKKRRIDADICASAIESITYHPVKVSNKLTTDLMEQYECTYLIRGLRNTTDYLYEENLIKQYKLLKPDLKVVYFRTENDVSSSFVYELMKRDKSITEYIPYDEIELDALNYIHKEAQ